MPNTNQETGTAKSMIPSEQFECANAEHQINADSIVRNLKRKGMVTPFLLFLTGHKPLAFAAGQFLYTIEPVAQILDIRLFRELAELLSDPQGVDYLADALATPVGDTSRASKFGHSRRQI